MTTTYRGKLTPMAIAIAVPLLAAGPLLAQQGVTDQTITDNVEDEILFDRSVTLNRIDVETNDGVVTITGTVTNLLEKQRAARIAEMVKGVEAVVNRIRIEPSAMRSDSGIRSDIEDALLYDSATESFEIDVEVQDGKAVLTGTVQSWQEKMLAEKVAKGVRGVTALENDIEIDYPEDRSDVEIRTEVEKALRWDVLVDNGLIDVSVDDGKVKLSGTVGSAAEKRQARADAWVYGVQSVDATGLEVARWARDDDLRKDKYVYKPDGQIVQAVKDALFYDPRLLSENVDVEADGGIVTLRGVVENQRAKRAAEQDARRTVGVTAVTNRLRVRPEGELQDREIAESVRNALMRDPYVERFEIDVTAVDGIVYLSGVVDSYFEKQQADEIAAGATGVTDVINNIDVEYDQYPLTYEPYFEEYDPYDFDWYDYEPDYTFESDAEIEAEVEDEIWWSPFVDAGDVEVDVEGGVATLTGTVDTWSEYRAARNNAFQGGATWVINNLEVE